MSIVATPLAMPTEIYTGPYPPRWKPYVGPKPVKIASATGHRAIALGSFGPAGSTEEKETFGAYLLIYEWPWDRLYYLLLPQTSYHYTFEPVGSMLFACADIPAGQMWYRVDQVIPGKPWQPYTGAAVLSEEETALFPADASIIDLAAYDSFKLAPPGDL